MNDVIALLEVVGCEPGMNAPPESFQRIAAAGLITISPGEHRDEYAPTLKGVRIAGLLLAGFASAALATPAEGGAS